MNTLGEYLKGHNKKHDEDVYVDGIGGITVCGRTEFTKEGYEHFKDCLNLPMDGLCVMGEAKDYKDLELWEYEDKGNGGRLMLAWDLLAALAGYCACSDYEKWFIEED